MDTAQGLHYGRHIAMQSQNRRQEQAYGERFEGPPGCGRKRQNVGPGAVRRQSDFKQFHRGINVNLIF